MFVLPTSSSQFSVSTTMTFMPSSSMNCGAKYPTVYCDASQS